MRKSIWAEAGLCLLSLSAAAEPADMVILSNHVIDMTQSQQASAQPRAIAIDGERIVWTGSLDAGEQWIGPETRTIRLETEAVLPGFIDAHGHASFVAFNTQMVNVASPPVGPVNTIAQLQDTLREHIRKNAIPPGGWVVGNGYDDSLLAETRHPDRDDLDAVSDQHPILLLHVSGHLAAANSRALARAGINAESPDPDGGVIRRRAKSSEPNGVLEETATYPLRPFIAEVNKNPMQAVAAAMQTYASFGVTTAQDGAASADIVALLKAADAAGHVDLDVILYPVGQPDSQALTGAFDYGRYQGRVKVGGVKLLLDGSPQGKTAYMTRPYLHPPAGQKEGYRGYPTLPQAQVERLVSAYLDQRIPIIAHANGDAAADMLIDAVAAAAPAHDHRTVMIHAQTVREDQLTRMKALAMVPSYFSAHTFYWGDWHRDSVFGEARASRISPTASTVARGMPFTVHNDAPIVPPDMLRLLWATTNRLTRSGKVLGPDQRISTYDALRAITVNAAYQHFEEDIKGTLQAGKQADIVILSRDPLSVDAKDLLDIEVVATVARGRQVFGQALW